MGQWKNVSGSGPWVQKHEENLERIVHSEKKEKVQNYKVLKHLLALKDILWV